MPAVAEPTEVEWQTTVTDAADALGWRWLHVRKSVGKGSKWVTTTNVRGWPDLFLWHHRHGTAAFELKVGRNTATDEQVAVLEQLRAAGVAVMVAYPDDFDAVVSILQGK
jgi:hypothetical protein